MNLPKKRIEAFINQKSGWIIKHQAIAIQVKPTSSAERFTDGQNFWFLGKCYPLKIVNQPGPALFLNDAFCLSESSISQAEAVFQAWYRLQANQIINERTAEIARKSHLHYQAIKITTARSRWGSCSPKDVLSFPWRLVMAPLPVIDYVVIHELVHTVERNHQKKFWDIVARLDPGFQDHIKWLKSNSPALRIL